MGFNMNTEQNKLLIKKAVSNWKRLKRANRYTKQAANSSAPTSDKGALGFGNVGDYAISGLGGAAASSLLYNVLGGKNKTGLGQAAALLGGAGVGAGGMGIYKNLSSGNPSSPPTNQSGNGLTNIYNQVKEKIQNFGAPGSQGNPGTPAYPANAHQVIATLQSMGMPREQILAILRGTNSLKRQFLGKDKQPAISESTPST